MPHIVFGLAVNQTDLGTSIRDRITSAILALGSYATLLGSPIGYIECFTVTIYGENYYASCSDGKHTTLNDALLHRYLCAIPKLIHTLVLYPVSVWVL